MASTIAMAKLPSRKKLRSTIAKLNPPQLRPVLLHFFAHTDTTIAASLVPIKEVIDAIQDHNKKAIDRIEELEVSESQLREVATIATKRQSLLENKYIQTKQMLERVNEQQERQEKRIDKELQRIIQDKRAIDNEIENRWRSEFEKLQSKIRKLELSAAATTAATAAATAAAATAAAAATTTTTTTTTTDPPAPIPPPAPSTLSVPLPTVVPPLLPQDVEMTVERHVARGLGIVASSVVKLSDQVNKLRHRSKKFEHRQSDAHTTLSAELMAMLASIKELQYESSSLRATHSVHVGTTKADVEMLRDDFRTLSRNSDPARLQKIVKVLQSNVERRIQRIQRRTEVLANHQVQLGNSLAKCISSS
jgi:hypothetical protein